MKRSSQIHPRPRMHAAACLVLASIAAEAQESASRMDKNQMITIVYGKVIAVDDVKLDTAAGGGAVMGGMVGLATQHGERNRDKVGGAAAGAMLGALLTRAAEGKRTAEAFTVQQNTGGTVKVIQDHADIRVGDCVAVEQGRTSNVRRVSDLMCEQGPHLTDNAIGASHQQDAGECAQAKQEVLNAKSDVEFARAEKKVTILCQ